MERLKFSAALAAALIFCIAQAHAAPRRSQGCVTRSSANYTAKKADFSRFYAAAEQTDTGSAQPEPDSVRVIVGFNDNVSPQELSNIIAGPIIHKLESVNAVSAVVPVSTVDEIAKNPAVRAVELDAEIQAFDFRSSQVTPPGITKTRAPEAWATTMGQGSRVAIIDTGLDPAHPDLQGRVAGGRNFSSGDPRAWRDDHGHGSHVGGIVAANNDGMGVVGVAPRASLYSIKALDGKGGGSYSDVVASIEYAVESGAQVVNLSLGGTADIEAMHEAVILAHLNNVLLVAASGNSAEKTGNPLNYPAAYPEVVSVGAVDDQDQRAYFSSYNKYVALGAGGVNVLSLGLNGSYVRQTGTSMAAPHVAGVAALLRSVFPEASVTELKRRLVCNAADQWPAGRDSWTGYGLVDAVSAIRNPAPADCTYLRGPVTEPVIPTPVEKPAPPSGSNIAYAETTAFSLVNSGESQKQLLVTVRIVDDRGRPLQRASVTTAILERETGPLGTATAVTNNDGEAQFVLTGFSCGRYIAKVTGSNAPRFSDRYGQPEAETSIR